MLLLWMLLLITILYISKVSSLPDLSQSCVTNQNIPFTGYKIEYQLNIRDFTGEYHLLYCNDNKLLYDLNLNESIPWTEPLNFSKTDRANTLILARRKTFALRTFPIYLPNTLVGSIYYTDDINGFDIHSQENITSSLKSIPLLASNVIRNWIEMTYKLDLIYHVPILTTPGIDSKRYKIGFFESNKELNNWDKYISMSEDYNYNYDSRVLVRQAVDRALKQINLVIDGSRLVKSRLKNSEVKDWNGKVFWKLILLSKTLKELAFQNLLERIEKSFLV